MSSTVPQPISGGSPQKDQPGGRPHAGSAWKRPVATAAAFVVAASLCGGLWWNFATSSEADIPDVELAHSPPEVAAAVTKAQTAVRDQPESAEAWGRLGMVLQANDFVSPAVTCLARAETLDPQSVRWPYLRGAVLATTDRQAAAECLRRAAELPGAPPAVKLRLAELLLEQERFDETHPILDAVLERDPTNARAALCLARLLHQQGKLDLARQWATKSMQSAPQQRAPRELLAQIAYQQGDRAAAHALLDELQELPQETTWPDPMIADVLRLRRGPGSTAMRAQELLDRGRITQAIALLEDLVRERPQADEYLALGRALIAAGEGGRAGELLDRAVAAHPDSPELRRLRGATLYAQGRWNEAADMFRQAIRLKPDDTLAYYNLGHSLLKLDDPDGALRAFREAAACQPDYANAHINISQLLMAANRRQEALEHARTALRLAPDDPAATTLYDELKDEP